MRRSLRQSSRGFTLLEILLSIAIFALGGVAILALFLAFTDRARQAADANRAVEIASTVRETIEASLASPPIVVGTGENVRYLYPIAFPFASLVNLSTRSGPNQAKDGVSPVDLTRFENDPVPTYYLELPKQPYRGEGAIQRGLTMMFLPGDLRDRTGAVARVLDLGAGASQTVANSMVFYWRPDSMSIAGERALGPGIDRDDADIYSFNFRIDRSVARADFNDPRGGGKMLLPGLYQVRLRVYRGYQENELPFEEFVFAVRALE
jgi:type II secretory pathway pseudopilin PulG